MPAGWSQNMNESFHSNVWAMCPKIKFCRFYRVRFIVQVAILNHNLGYNKCNLMTKLFGTNQATQEYLEMFDNEKKRQAALYMKDKHKKIKVKEAKSKEYMSGSF